LIAKVFEIQVEICLHTSILDTSKEILFGKSIFDSKYEMP